MEERAVERESKRKTKREREREIINNLNIRF